MPTTYGLTINAENGWSAITQEPNMTTLLKTGQSELWACTLKPHTVHYHERGIIVQRDDAYTPWKRRTFAVVGPPGHEATRFRQEKQR